MQQEVEAKVGEALLQLWMPIAESFGIQDIVINDIDDRKRLLDETLHFDNDQWDHLVDLFEKSVGDIANVWSTSNELRLSIDGIKHFSITVSREPYDADEDIDGSEIDGMTREDAIDYLTDLDEIPSFEYARIEIFTGSHCMQRLVGVQDDENDFSGIIFPIVNGLAKTPEIFREAIRTASIELQQKAEKQREIDNRLKARNEERERMLADFTAQIESALAEAGWNGKYSVSMNFDNFVLSLRLSSFDECRYESPIQSDIIAKIGELVNFANAYRSLKIAGGTPILHGNQVRTATWSDIPGK